MRTQTYKRTTEGFYNDGNNDLIPFDEIDPIYHNENELILELNPKTCSCDTFEKALKCFFSSFEECCKRPIVKGDFYGIKAKHPINVLSKI